MSREFTRVNPIKNGVPSPGSTGAAGGGGPRGAPPPAPFWGRQALGWCVLPNHGRVGTKFGHRHKNVRATVRHLYYMRTTTRHAL